jgi:hypothetical protein
MKKMWTVILNKPTTGEIYPRNYFPRSCYYKKDAQKLIDEVKALGGEAAFWPPKDKKHAQVDL